MAYIYGDRQSQEMFPPSLEEYVGVDDPVRVYDAFADMLDMNELGLIRPKQRVGAPEYEPRAMLKLLVYAYAYGLRSSRKIERACYHNVSFMWLTGGLKPDHKTISRFRKDNRKALEKVLTQCVRMCVKLGLIKGNTLFVDGSKFKANASADTMMSKEQLNKELIRINKNIKRILDECDRIDDQEQSGGSLVELDEELKDSKKRKEKIKQALEELKKKGNKKINTTDRDSVWVKQNRKIVPGYNVQIVTDDEHGLIVGSDVVSESNDTRQFSEQIKKAQDNTERKCENAVADTGYVNTQAAAEIEESGTQVIMPIDIEAGTNTSVEIKKDSFFYDEPAGQYICPEGRSLKYLKYDKRKNHTVYQIESPEHCINCKHWGRCTKSKTGRTINRKTKEKIRQKISQRYKSPQGQQIYSRRKYRIESIFGYIKQDMHAEQFLLRGLESVRAETGLLALGYNIKRMIEILGSTRLTTAFGG